MASPNPWDACLTHKCPNNAWLLALETLRAARAAFRGQTLFLVLNDLGNWKSRQSQECVDATTCQRFNDLAT